MAGVDINTLTMEQFLALARGNQAPSVVKPEIGGNVNFEIKSQFMLELREDTFFGNKIKDTHDHVDRILSIVSLFNIPRVSKDVVMLRVFPFTLTGAAKRWAGPIPEMTPAQALTAIQTMTDHSQKWHDQTSRRSVSNRPHLDKECPLNEEVKEVEEVKYEEFGRPAPFNESNRAKFHEGPPGYDTRTNNRSPCGEKRPRLEDL
nr:hypothetical protein [Tanacetum cinerariifolium]